MEYGDDMKRHVRAITYKPKIESVLNGSCTQTIRAGRSVQKGDEILFHGWKDVPYKSKWSWRRRVRVSDTVPLMISDEGICVHYGDNTEFQSWDSLYVNTLAISDGISPPTGEALREALFGPKGAPKQPERFQVIRWGRDPIETL